MSFSTTTRILTAWVLLSAEAKFVVSRRQASKGVAPRRW